MGALVVVSAAVLGVWVVNFAIGFLEMRRAPRPSLVPAPAGAPVVQILIPARNEADALEACLRSVLAQDYPDFAVAIYEDRSSDATPEIIARCASGTRLRCVAGTQEPPAGWFGKPHALHRLYEAVRPTAPWLLFLDADVVLHPGTLSAAVAYAEREGAGALSLLPRNVCDGFWIRVVQPAVAAIVAFCHRPRVTNADQRPERGFANGQFILVRRADYERAGGHEAVRDQVLEDVNLARVMRRHGVRTLTAIGDHLMSTRMYAHLPELIEGWSKNLFILAGRDWGTVVKLSVMMLVLPTVPLVTFVAGLGAGGGYALYGAAQYAAVLGMAGILRAMGPGYPAYTPLAPLGNAIGVYILWLSALRISRGRAVPWKGRAAKDGG